MRFRGILFDKDGTLIEAHDIWPPLYRGMLMRMKGINEDAANALLEQAGYDVAQDRVAGGTAIAGGTTSQLVDLWWPEASAEERLRVTRSIDETDKQAHEVRVTPVVELHSLLKALRASGFAVGIATNDSWASTVRHMEQLGVLEFFDAVICADTVDVPKPSGKMIRAFAEKVGIAPHEIIMVGDNHHDMSEAVQGGAGYKVAVLSGNSVHQELAHLADVTLNHIGELPDHLESLRVL